MALTNISRREKKLAVEDTLRIMNQNIKHLINCSQYFIIIRTDHLG